MVRVGVRGKVQEDRYDEYREFSGIKYPTRRRSYLDGVLTLEGRDERVTFLAEVDEATFARP